MNPEKKQSIKTVFNHDQVKTGLFFALKLVKQHNYFLNSINYGKTAKHSRNILIFKLYTKVFIFNYYYLLLGHAFKKREKNRLISRFYK